MALGASRKALVLLLVPTLLVSMLGTMALAEEQDWEMKAPKYKVGDYWEYEVKKDGATYTEKHTVDKVSDIIEIKFDGQYQNGSNTVTMEGEITLEGSDLSERERVVTTTETGTVEVRYQYSPSLKYYQWPMKNDDSWSSDTTLTVTEDRNGKVSTDTYTPSFKFNVEGAEKKDSDGKEYVVVEIKMSWSDGHRNIWYSPDVGNVVREEDDKGNTRELKDFKCDDPGDIKGMDDGQGGFDLMAMGMMCLALPVIAGVIIGVVFGTIFGLSSGYSSKIPVSRTKRSGRSGPKFCPRHGIRTEKRGGARYCHECGGYPKTQFKYCPQHGVRLQMTNGVPTCFECGGEVKW